MKNLIFPLLALSLVLGAGRAQAQDKPVLNSTPALPPPTVTPVPAVTPAPTRTMPDESPVQPLPPASPNTAPPVEPTPDNPSGLSFPGRNVPATEKEDAPLSKMFIYSNFGLGYSAYNGYSQFNASASPALGYRVTSKFALGPGISYAYNNYSFGRNNGPSLSTSSVGVKGFAQYIVYKEFFLHAEYEVTNAELLAVDQNGYLTGGKVKRTVSTPLAGVGYRNWFSDNVAVDFVLLYNFNDGYDSIYSNPVFRFSFLFNIGR